MLLEGGHSGDLGGEGTRECEKGVGWGCFCVEKRRSLGAGRCGVRARLERRHSRAHGAQRTHAFTLTLTPLSLSVTHTNWAKAASFLRPDKHSHSLTGAHTREATDICGYMQQIHRTRARRFDCVSSSSLKEGQLNRAFLYLFIQQHSFLVCFGGR